MGIPRVGKAHFVLLVVAFIWGATFVVVKAALAQVSPLLFNAVRMLVAALCLSIIFWKWLPRITGEIFKAGTLAGVFLWLGYEFQTTGLRLTTPSKSGFLTGISVVLVPIFLALFWKRKVNHWTGIGVLMAFLGLFLMAVPSGTGGNRWSGDWSSVNLGDVLTLGCAVAFALQIIFLGRATSRFAFQPIALLQTAVAAVLMFATIPLLERDAHLAWTPVVLGAIAVTAILGTALAFTAQAWAQQFTPPTHTALIFSLEPVFAWLTSYIVLKERLGWRAGSGALLILAGVLVSELKGGESQQVQREVSAG